jgi:hypothetical protein
MDTFVVSGGYAAFDSSLPAKNVATPDVVIVATHSRRERSRDAKYCLCCEVVELISGRQMNSASTLHLSFHDHVHNFNAGQKDPGAAKSLEPQQGPRTSFDRPMVLLNQIIEIFALTDLDGRFTTAIDRFERGAIGAAFVDGYRLWYSVLSDRFLKVTPGRSLVPMGAG